MYCLKFALPLKKVGCILTIKIKKDFFYFVLSKICTTFALAYGKRQAQNPVFTSKKDFRKLNQVDPLAQLVEHNTFNVGVLGSSPKRITQKKERRTSPFFVHIPEHGHPFPTFQRKRGFPITYRLHIRLGSMHSLYSHSSPCSCHHFGARCAVPA